MAEPTGIASVGLDWKLFISQVINFLLLLWILKIFAYRPILKTLENRRKAIEKSLDTVKIIEKRQRELEEKEHLRLLKAQEKSDLIIAQAKQSAQEMEERLFLEIEKERKIALDRLTQQIETLRKEAMHQAKNELAELVISASERVLGNVMTKNLNEKIIEQTAQEVKRELSLH